MSKWRNLLLLFTAGVFLSTALNADAQRQPRKTPKAKIQTEAQGEAAKLVRQFVTRCGESYLGYINGMVFEWRGLHIDTRAEKLTMADNLNKVTFKATIVVGFQAEFRNGMWHAGTASRAFCLSLKKENGVWQPNACMNFMAEAYGGVPPERKPTCGELLSK